MFFWQTYTLFQALCLPRAGRELQRWAVQGKVMLVEVSDSGAAPQYGACFFSTLEGFDKLLQGTLNHHVEDA